MESDDAARGLEGRRRKRTGDWNVGLSGLGGPGSFHTVFERDDVLAIPNGIETEKTGN